MSGESVEVGRLVEGLFRQWDERLIEGNRIIAGNLGRIIYDDFDHIALRTVVLAGSFVLEGEVPTVQELDAVVCHIESERAGGDMNAQASYPVSHSYDSVTLNCSQRQQHARSSEQEQEECVAPLSPASSPISAANPQQPSAQFATPQLFSASPVEQIYPDFTVLEQAGCQNRHPSSLRPYSLPEELLPPMPQLFPPQLFPPQLFPPQIFPPQIFPPQQVTSVLNTPGGPVNIIFNQNGSAQSVASVSMVEPVEPSSARASIPTKAPLPGSTQVANNAPSQQPSGLTGVAFSAEPPQKATLDLIEPTRFITQFTSDLAVTNKNVTVSGPAPVLTFVSSDTDASSSTSTSGASLKIVNVSPGVRTSEPSAPSRQTVEEHSMIAPSQQPSGLNGVASSAGPPQKTSFNLIEPARFVNQLTSGLAVANKNVTASGPAPILTFVRSDKAASSSTSTSGASLKITNVSPGVRTSESSALSRQTVDSVVAQGLSSQQASEQSNPLIVNKNRLNVGQNLTQNEPNPSIMIQNYGGRSPKPGPLNVIAPNVQLQLNTMQRPEQYSPGPRRSDRIQKRAANPMPSTSWYDGSTPAKQVRTGSLPIELNTNQLSTPVHASNSKYEETKVIVWQMVTKQMKCIIDNCKEVLKGKTQLKNHLKRVHKSSVHVCVVQGCGQSFEKSIKYMVHLRQVHRGVKSWPCTKCDLAPFESASNLNTHIKLEHERGLFGCNFVQCDFTSVSRKNVLDHVLNVHRKVAK